MATILTINRSTPNDSLGDTLYNQAGLINDNFAEVNLKKVEVEAGKGLTENNYSDADVAKLASIATGAEVNVQADWNEANPSSDAYILNKPTISDGSTFIFDGIIGVTVGFAVAQQSFILPTGSIAKDVWLSHTKQYKTTANNVSLVNRWSQTGDTVTITKTPALNNYLYIEYE